MAEEDDADKTEDPTEKKKEKAKEKGQTANSMEVKSWVVLMIATLGLAFMASGIATDVRLLSTKFIEFPDQIPMDNQHLIKMMADTLLQAGLTLAPFVGLLL
ncbi:MAG TPA: flagellar biosynthesis protein FlhB, partial [Rhodospirillales bacterium]|nr:flagellar biosynthesis protein FlhB [Rhodospirillales bacterium]